MQIIIQLQNKLKGGMIIALSLILFGWSVIIIIMCLFAFSSSQQRVVFFFVFAATFYFHPRLSVSVTLTMVGSALLFSTLAPVSLIR